MKFLVLVVAAFIPLSSAFAAIDAFPSMLMMSARAGGTDMDRVQITNRGSEAVSITIMKSGDPEFRINDFCSGRLGPGDRCSISVTFAPKTAKSYRGRIGVYSGAGGASVSLQGTGR